MQQTVPAAVHLAHVSGSHAARPASTGTNGAASTAPLSSSTGGTVDASLGSTAVHSFPSHDADDVTQSPAEQV